MSLYFAENQTLKALAFHPESTRISHNRIRAIVVSKWLELYDMNTAPFPFAWPVMRTDKNGLIGLDASKTLRDAVEI